jgi:hypothetical protein
MIRHYSYEEALSRWAECVNAPNRTDRDWRNLEAARARIVEADNRPLAAARRARWVINPIWP